MASEKAKRSLDFGIEFERVNAYVATQEQAREVMRQHGGNVRPLPEQELRRRKGDARFVVTYWRVKE